MEFAAGLILGVVAGFFLYPLYWSWIAWREHQAASRQARRIGDVLADMTSQTGPKERKVGEDGARPRTLRLIDS